MAKKQQQQQRENFETVIVKAQITATSNKFNGKYKQKTPTKSVYIVPENAQEEQKLIDFGLTRYTPDNGNANSYFIVKATQFVKFYTSQDEYEEVYFGTQTEEVNSETGEMDIKKALNYSTAEPVYLSIMFVEGSGYDNDFYRLNAIMHKDRTILEELQPVNPFASLFDGNTDLFA